MVLKLLASIVLFSPLLGSVISGLFGKRVGVKGAHSVTIALMSLALLAAVGIFKIVVVDGHSYNGILYTWVFSGGFAFNMGFLIDNLTAIMMLTVIFVSLLVHVYSVGYMAGDPGYQRFFSYMSLFTFFMLLLVSANNFLQLFFGWEGVGLVSYLLIGFWFYKESAATGSLKAFLINRVADFGFILGIAAILTYFGSLDYQTVFSHMKDHVGQTIDLFPGAHGSLITVIGILLFIGAMGKSAQMPLHVWLPESMEGPTPISALIHAATMVTAGVFMVARMSPLYEFSQTALSFILIIGSTTALFTGLLAFVENDIKRVIAFSTMSQLGYMMAGDAASAYQAGIFHLMTHACFKSLLFLAAGSVIIALHHEQDVRKMGGLKKYIPVTYWMFLIGALALSALPPFSGFYSKDPIIDAVHFSTIPGSQYAYMCLLIGTFVTAYYIFRIFFMAFHSEEHTDLTLRSQIKEPGWSLRFPMLLLAIPSVILGFSIMGKALFDVPGLFGTSVYIAPGHDELRQFVSEYHNAWRYTAQFILSWPFWLAILGIVCAGFNVLVRPELPQLLQRRFPRLHQILVNRYGFDAFNNRVFVRGGLSLSEFFYRVGDLKIIDGFFVEGSGRNTTRMSEILRRLQSGYLYHYVFVMIIGLLAFLIWLVLLK